MKTPKILRKWVKDEKRIVRLLYRKGLIDKFHGDITGLYWEAFKRVGKIYTPEVHCCESDYWGGCEEYSVIDKVLTCLWNHRSFYDGESEEIKSTFNYKSRKWFIRYLSSLPTKRNDSKINRILNRRNR